MLTITRILMATYSGYNVRIPLTQFHTHHRFDYAIGTTHSNLADAIAFLKPALTYLQDLEQVFVSYIVGHVEDETAIWPRDYTPFTQGVDHEIPASQPPDIHPLCQPASQRD